MPDTIQKVQVALFFSPHSDFYLYLQLFVHTTITGLNMKQFAINKHTKWLLLVAVISLLQISCNPPYTVTLKAEQLRKYGSSP